MATLLVIPCTWAPAPVPARRHRPVVADIIDLARLFDAPAQASVNHLAFNDIQDLQVLPMDEVETRYLPAYSR